MPVDHIRYDILVQEALRGMVRDVLAEAAKTKAMPGDHHFFITFDTQAEGARLSERLKAQYPEEMTIVLQHQFWDLKVTDELFEVGLSFGGVAERLVVPLDAIKSFADPSVQFTLQFETLAEDAEPEVEAPRKAPRSAGEQAGRSGKTSVPATPFSKPAAPEKSGKKSAAADKVQDKNPDDDKPGFGGQSGGAEVVRLDRFRKK
jgi:hypothetical protein